MLHFLLGDIWYHIEMVHKFVPQCVNGRNILFFHLPQTMYTSLRREVEYSDHPCHRRVARHARESHIHKFRDIEATMEVSTGGDRCWEYHSSCVDCLESALQVASSSDLLDEYGGQSFRAQLFVYTKEVNFGYFDDAARSQWSLDKCTMTHFFRIRSVIGTALMNATSFLLDDTLTPTFHSGNQPGGCNAHRKNSAE